MTLLESPLVYYTSGVIPGFSRSPRVRAVIPDVNFDNFRHFSDILAILALLPETHEDI